VNLKSLILAILVVLICVGGIFALKSWPETPQRIDDAAIMAAVDSASRQLTTAQNLLAAPVLTFKGEFLPIMVDFTQADQDLISLPPRYTPNAKAQATLRQAYDSLLAVIREHSAATSDVQATAHVLAGRIAATEGFYYAALAAAKHHQAAVGRQKVSELVHAMQQQDGEIKIHQLSASLNIEEAEKALQGAQAEHQRLQQAIQTKNQEVAKAQKEWEDLRDQTAQKTAQANKLRLEAERGKPKEQLAKMDQVHKLEQEEIYPQYRRIDQLEAAFKALQAEMERLKSKEAISATHVQAAQRILDGAQDPDAAKSVRGLKAIRTAGTEGLEDARSRLAACRQEVEKTLNDILAACEESAKAEALANTAYKTAVERFKAAIPVADKPTSAQASYAETLVAWAESDYRSLRLHLSNTAFLSEIGQAWPKVEGTAAPPPAASAPAPAAEGKKGTVASLLSALTGGGSGSSGAEDAKPVALGDLPPVAQKISGYLSKPGEVRQEAVRKYTEAIELYKKAIAAAGATHRWLYQGALGAAYAGLARVGDQGQRAEAVSNATAAFNEALQGKEGSPFVAPIADMQGQISQQ